jgi:hypothetical protein
VPTIGAKGNARATGVAADDASAADTVDAPTDVDDDATAAAEAAAEADAAALMHFRRGQCYEHGLGGVFKSRPVHASASFLINISIF